MTGAWQAIGEWQRWLEKNCILFLHTRLTACYAIGAECRARNAAVSNSHYADESLGRARHSVRAVRSRTPQDRRARSDAPYQPDKMRIAALLWAKHKKLNFVGLAGNWARIS